MTGVLVCYACSIYNIFVMVNISVSEHPEEKISKLLSLIGQPVRIQILLVIGTQEACVCHLEMALGVRQASISQHLMVLRKAGVVTSRRDGRNIFYRVMHPEVLDVLQQVAQLTGCSPEMFHALALRPVPDCPCPHCNPGIDPNLSCQNFKSSRSS
jgi:DNA-binding transcriptional ArsR family regulator